MKMVVDFKNSNKETEYNESSLIIVDFASKTINVHPDQFVLDMVKLLPDVDEEKYSVVTISCVDNNQKKCNFSATYFKTGEIILRITFDDTDYVYFVKSN